MAELVHATPCGALGNGKEESEESGKCMNFEETYNEL
jgi:hypothetical protein